MQPTGIAVPKDILWVRFLNFPTFQKGALKVNEKLIRPCSKSGFDGGPIGKELVVCSEITREMK